MLGESAADYSFSTSFVPAPAEPFIMTYSGYLHDPTNFDISAPDLTREDLPIGSDFFVIVNKGKITFMTDSSAVIGTNLIEYNIAFTDYPTWYNVS